MSSGLETFRVPYRLFTSKRFWSKVDTSGECWLWKAYKNPQGYGSFKLLNGKAIRAHRFAYEWNGGIIPNGQHVCHQCDNPSCVRPNHLFLGTNYDNVCDRVAKGRQSRGERVWTAKLTERDVQCIREEYANGKINQTRLAESYGVGSDQISRIVNGIHWKHVNG